MTFFFCLAVAVVRVKKVLTMNEFEIAYKVKINRVFKVCIITCREILRARARRNVSFSRRVHREIV